MKKIKVSIIAAIGKNRELGKDNKLLWHIPEDLERFKKLTIGHPIIMGRKTWDSLPFKPLPNRCNIVITRDLGFKINDLRKGKGFAIAGSLKEAIEIAKRLSGEELADDCRIDSGQAGMTKKKQEAFVIGGGQIYKQAIEKGIVDKLYLTIVNKSFDADTFFPEYSQFRTKIYEKAGEHGKYKYRFIALEK